MNIIDCHTHNCCSQNAIINIDDFNIEIKSNLLYSAGLHPWHIEKYDNNIFTKINSLASLSNVVAIGECGIDKLISTPIVNQIKEFEKHIILSETLKKPLIIHCVRAWQELLGIYKHFKPSQRWIVHGFRGKPTIAKKLADEGLFLSFGGKFNKESLLAVPYNNILIETDDSKDISIYDVAHSVAMALDIDDDSLFHIIDNNIKTCFAK